MGELLKELKTLIQQVLIFTPRAVVGLLIFFCFWFVGTVIKRIIQRFGRKIGPIKKDVFNLIGQSVKGVLIIVGAVMALGRMGINVTALVAGLGLTGFALGFALRDVLSNSLAGALVLIYRPFERKDRITVAGFEGIVTAIDLRYTTLQGEGQRILIPNSILFTNAIRVSRIDE